MKFDKIFLAMLIVLVASSIGIAVAAEGTAGSHTFTVPDGFEVTNTTDEMTVLEKDNEHAIVVMLSNEIASSEDAKKTLESKGYTFINEGTYNADGKDVQQQNFEKDGLTVLAYVFDVGSEKCIVTYTIPSSETPPEGSDNPVTTILNTIE